MGAGLGLVSLRGGSRSFAVPGAMCHGVLHRLRVCASLACSPLCFSAGLGTVSWDISTSAAQVFVKGRVHLSKAGHEGHRNPGQSYSSSSVLASGQMSSGCLEKGS